MQATRYGRLVIFLIIALSLSTGYSASTISSGYPDFEIVESIPVESSLDNPEIRNAPEVWMDMITHAKKSIDIEQFYISNKDGSALDDVIKAIIAAGDRGVKVRLIVEAKMYKTYPETVELIRKSKNTSVRIIDYGKLAGGVMHAKFFIIDHQQVFMGSQNFDWRALQHIHELGVRIQQPECIKIFGDIFELDWKLAEKNDPALLKKLMPVKTYQVPIRINEPGNEVLEFTPVASPKGWIPSPALWDEKKIVDLIDHAKQSVSFQVLTYSPAERGGYYAELDNALRRAAGRGVNVKMIISDWSKRKPVVNHLKSLSVIPNIEVKFSTIPASTTGYVSYARVEHCKYLVVDTADSWIGTSNWEKGYFYTSRNLGVIIKNERIASTLNQIFKNDWEGPYTYPVKPEVEYVAPKTSD